MVTLTCPLSCQLPQTGYSYRFHHWLQFLGVAWQVPYMGCSYFPFSRRGSTCWVQLLPCLHDSLHTLSTFTCLLAWQVPHSVQVLASWNIRFQTLGTDICVLVWQVPYTRTVTYSTHTRARTHTHAHTLGVVICLIAWKFPHIGRVTCLLDWEIPHAGCSYLPNSKTPSVNTGYIFLPVSITGSIHWIVTCL